VTDSLEQLRKFGVAVLAGAFDRGTLASLKAAAVACFEVIERGQPVPEHYHFNRFSNSVALPALDDFGCTGSGRLQAPLDAAGLGVLFADVLGCPYACGLDQSWVRKKYPPRHAMHRPYHTQDWHQDGALGVRFSVEPGPPPPLTRLLTCWVPLSRCGMDSPGLEFIRCPQRALLHFTELSDPVMRRRFAPDMFWAPELETGDALVFLNGTLHRTYLRPDMEHIRLSVEYRLFPL